MTRSRLVLVALAVLLAPGALRAPAGAASKTRLAAIGDAAPGGGVFAGPSFAGWPAAAGDGWLAFRSTVEGGSTSEVLVAAHMNAPVTRVEVARLGLALPNGDRLKQFIGRPAINAHGDVAFMALLTPAKPATEPDAPDPAGVFLFRQSPPAGEPQLVQVAASGQQTTAGALDLATPVDLFADANAVDTPDRTPALNDADDVAFVSSVVGGPQDFGAIFSKPAGGDLAPVIVIGGPFDGGTFATLGPPALNNHGSIAFHALVDAAPPIDGIFRLTGGTITLLVRDRQTRCDDPSGPGLCVHEELPIPNDQPLSEFEDPVALNDDGDVAFMAGPLFDPSPDAALEDEGSSGVLVFRSGVVSLLGYPGQPLAGGRVTGAQLGPAAGSALASPSIAPNGSVVFFVSVNGGSSEAILRSDVPYTGFKRLVTLGGTVGTQTPAGGTYAGSASAPAIDASAGIAFFARVAGGSTSEALFYGHEFGAGKLPPPGDATAVVVGEGAPSSRAFFAGPPFSNPLCNDRGDVVFRSFVARDPASIGLYRVRDGESEALVRAGDPSPRGASFIDIEGEPSLNAAGAVAFAGNVQGLARGIYVVDANGTHAIAVRGDPAPVQPGATFSSLGLNPSIDDAGAVAFRGTARYVDPETLEGISVEGLFLADGAGIHALVQVGQPSPAGEPQTFLKFRDPVASNAGVVFRADLGPVEVTTTGIFRADLNGVSTVALDADDVGDGTKLTGFSGKPSVDAAGNVAFLATRAREGRDLGPAILRRGPGGLELVIAKNMSGPAGGTVKSLGQPTLASNGHIAFRASFLPQTGGTPGFFLGTEGGVVPYVGIGEFAQVRGTNPRKHEFSRLTSYGPRGCLNGSDLLAFIGNVSGSSARNGVFLASPATLSARALVVRLSDGTKKDRVGLRLVLRPGRLSNGLDPSHEPVAVSLADTRGTLWSVNVPAGTMKGRGRTFTARLGRELRKQVRSLRITVAGRGASARLALVSAPVDVTSLGLRRLKPPFSLTVQIGDDAGVAVVPCAAGTSGTVRCAAP